MKRKIEIAFYKAKNGDYVDKLISWFTWGEYSHAEIIFEDEVSFSSSPRDGGTRFKTIEFKPHHWSYTTIPVTDYEYDSILAFCNHEQGLGYDWWGVLSFILPWCRESKTKWFCTEVIVEALKSGLPKIDLKSNRTSPTGLFKYLNKYFGHVEK